MDIARLVLETTAIIAGVQVDIDTVEMTEAIDSFTADEVNPFYLFEDGDADPFAEEDEQEEAEDELWDYDEK